MSEQHETPYGVVNTGEPLWPGDPVGRRCTCPTFNPEEFDGLEDYVAACRDCPIHGTAATHFWDKVPTRPRGDDDTLGSCGCVDYHMADCPTRTGGRSDGSEVWSDNYDPYYDENDR